MIEMLEERKEKVSLKRVAPRCVYFGECGGCSLQDVVYEEQLRLKEEALKAMLQERFGLRDGIFEPITASPKRYHYRHRIDLRLQRTRNGILVGYTPKAGRGMLPVESCAIACESIDESIPAIKREAIGKLPEKYRRANLTVRASGDGRWTWGGIGRGSLRMKEEDYFSTTIDGKKVFYAMETFFQANLSILPDLIGRLRRFDFIDKDSVFYDLYAGVGLFGIMLAERVKRVVMIEEVGQSIALARTNCRHNRLKNVEILEGRTEEYLDKVSSKEADGRQVAMIDPPRAGLSDEARARLSALEDFSHFIYLSCNPQALTRDLASFVEKGWKVVTVVPFDFFPQTQHVETLVVMEKADG